MLEEALNYLTLWERMKILNMEGREERFFGRFPCNTFGINKKIKGGKNETIECFNHIHYFGFCF